ncbi:MAG TPA: RNA 3'-terminal phosphate cyclase [Polyangiales bacterium]
MTTLREILNRARWASDDLHTLELRVLHRGAPGDQRSIAGSSVMNVLAEGVEVAANADDSDQESVFVPYHRFLAIHAADGALLWDKQGGYQAQPTSLVLAEPREPPLALAREPDGVEVLPEFSVLLSPRSGDQGLVIDGSAGEGGGQILRSSLALSLISGTAFTLERVRAGRKKPGLMRQHLTAVKAAAAIADAEVEGASLGSTRLSFRPGRVRAGDYEFDVGSAGSAALVLQTVALPLAIQAGPSRVRVRGGTHAQWAPIAPFLQEAWLPLLLRAGFALELAQHAVGFYPAGGGELALATGASSPRPLHLVAARAQSKLELNAIVSGLPEGIARRELTSAAELLSDHLLTLHSATVKSPGPGNAAWLTARALEPAAASNVFSAIGEVGVSAEQVGRTIAQAYLRWRDSGAAVEEHLSDQIMLPIALAGEGSFSASALSLHARTNLEVIHAFTGSRFRVWQRGAACFQFALG